MEKKTCTIDQPEELQKMAYYVEDMLLGGFKRAPRLLNLVDTMTVLGLAVGHYVQGCEQMHDNLNSYLPHFMKAFEQSYKHFKSHPNEVFLDLLEDFKDAIDNRPKHGMGEA